MSLINMQPICNEPENVAHVDLAAARSRDDTPTLCEVDVEYGPAGHIVVLRVAGEIDIVTMPTVDEALTVALDRRSADIVIDLGGVSFCCVRGFALLATTARTAQSRGIGFAVSGMSPHLNRVANILWREEDCVRYLSVAAAVTAVRIDQTYRPA